VENFCLPNSNRSLTGHGQDLYVVWQYGVLFEVKLWIFVALFE